MNYYDELEVSTKASTEVIKAAYKAQAKQYHPDIYRGDPRFAAQKLKNLNLAYELLSDPQKRQEYDYLNNINNKNHSEYSRKSENYSNYDNKTSNNTMNKKENWDVIIAIFILLRFYVSTL